MEVVNRLSAPRSDVRHESVALLVDALGAGNRSRRFEELAEQRPVFAREDGGGCDVLLRHQQDVRWRARRDIADRHDVIVLMNLRRRQLAIDDPAEQAVVDAHPGPRYQSAGFVLIRKPIVPTSAAIAYDR